jgi:inorganic triphosphatase YgiF
VSGTGPGSVEREIKLEAAPDLQLPDLTGVAPGVTVEAEPALDLDATYVDTADLRLVRNGVSLRRRTGEGAPRWTLKLPTATDGAGLARREIEVEDPSHDVPPALAALVTGWARSAALVPVVVIRSHRERLRLVGEGGRELAELADDDVTVLEGDAVTARFREIEVELDEHGDDELLRVVTTALVAAGAGEPDPTSKVTRALGGRAKEPSELVAPPVGPTSTVADVVRAALTDAVARLVASDHVIRLDDDTDGVRRARGAVRRLRAALSTFTPVLDPEWADGLRDATSGLADALGPVRRTDALAEQLHRAIGALPAPQREPAVRLVAGLDDRRGAALGPLLGVLDDASYVALLDYLVAAALSPRPADGADHADPAATVLPDLVRPAWHHLHRSVHHLDHHPRPRDLVELRPAVRRAHLAVAIAAPVIGEPAALLSSGLADLQDVLGSLHHALVAEAWLGEVMPGLEGDEHDAAEGLGGLQQVEVEKAMQRWRDSWAVCDSDDASGWLA